MQTPPEVPPKSAATPHQQAEEEDRVARILARYGEDTTPDQAQEVRQALAELAGPEGPDAEPSAPALPRTTREDPVLSVRRWQRLVLAAIAAAVIVLLWHRLAWFG